jgi:transcriptional regulator with XRE-family HTH domain
LPRDADLRGVDDKALGQQFRTLRTAAGLSVPYIANLENGRGNPTIAALTRLAVALGTRMVVTIGPAAVPAQPSAVPQAGPRVTPSLVRLGRTRRFHQVAQVMAARLGRDPDEFSPQLVGALAAMAQALGKDLSEPDWWRLLDALLLVAAFPGDGHVQA